MVIRPGDPPDGSTEKVKLDVPAARRLYADALAAAKTAGFVFAGLPVRLTPQDKLVHIVRESQNRALAGEGGETDGATT